MNCNEQEIEYAHRILNHRRELEEKEVVDWLKDPEHLKLLDEIAALRQNLSTRDGIRGEKEVYTRIQRSILKQNRRPLILRWSIAASVLLLVGLLTGQIVERIQEKKTIPEKMILAEIKPGEIKAQLVMPDGKVTKLKSVSQRLAIPAIQGIKNDSLTGLSYAQVQFDDIKLTEQEIYSKLIVPTGGFYPLELSDGTKVWLNSESELEFPVKFLSDKRQVTLKGEAYFIVKRDSTRPFIVAINDASIEVLGTSFNVNTYGDEENVYTTLVNGSVRYISEKSKQEIILQPGMQTVMNAISGNTEIRKVEVQNFISWKEGRFVFQSMTLESIMQQLKRWYDINVFYQNPEVKKYEFRGVINRDMELNKVLDIISETTNITFNINNRTITISKQ